MSVSNAPCKGNSFKIHIIKKDNPLQYVKLFPIVLKLLPLQGALFATHKNPGRCPGLRASALSGRAAYQSFDTSGRVGQTCGSSIIYKGTRAQRYEMQTRKMSKSVAECRLSHDLTKRFVTP